MMFSRRLVLALVFAGFAAGAGLAAGCGTAGSGPPARVPRTGLTAADLYPLIQGFKWAYDLEKDGEKILATYAVVESNAKGATILAGGEKLSYVTSLEGIAQIDGGGVGDFILKNPVTKGAKWPVAGGTAEIVSTTEEVTVEAGHFYDCAVVEVTRTDPPRLARTTFAPDVGPVALEVQVQEGGKYVVKTRARLRAVTRPGEDLFGTTP
jgi:hypothetical protein